MNDTLMRQWAMLRAIPRHPRKIDARTLHAHLQGLGMTVTLRTVQRDLHILAEGFALEGDTAKPQGWCWRAGAGQLEVPGMDSHAALTFKLVQQYMQHLLPRSTLNHLAPWFDAADGVARAQVSQVTRWQDKLRVVPHSLNKLPTVIAPHIQATIYDGIMQERQLQVTYRALSGGHEAKSYPVHPLGLVVMEQVLYLVCTVKDYPDARFLALHRIDAVHPLDAPARQPEGFDLDAFVARELGIRLSPAQLHLVLHVRGVLGKYLVETPVSDDQTTQALDDTWTRLEARVPDTVQVRTWIRSLGADAVVVEPKALREEMAQQWQTLVGLYGAPKDPKADTPSP